MFEIPPQTLHAIRGTLPKSEKSSLSYGKQFEVSHLKNVHRTDCNPAMFCLFQFFGKNCQTVVLVFCPWQDHPKPIIVYYL